MSYSSTRVSAKETKARVIRCSRPVSAGFMIVFSFGGHTGGYLMSSVNCSRRDTTSRAMSMSSRCSTKA